MGKLTLVRRPGEEIRLTIDPGVDTEKLLRLLLRDGIALRVESSGRSRVRLSLEAPNQLCISRAELGETGLV